MESDEFCCKWRGRYGSRGYNWEDAIQNAMSTNHDLSFSKSTDNSSTRISIGASNTEGIVNRTGLNKYTFALNNSNDFWRRFKS
jgi:iron complex outermembrane receptor protein